MKILGTHAFLDLLSSALAQGNLHGDKMIKHVNIKSDSMKRRENRSRKTTDKIIIKS